MKRGCCFSSPSLHATRSCVISCGESFCMPIQRAVGAEATTSACVLIDRRVGRKKFLQPLAFFRFVHALGDRGGKRVNKQTVVALATDILVGRRGPSKVSARSLRSLNVPLVEKHSLTTGGS